MPPSYDSDESDVPPPLFTLSGPPPRGPGRGNWMSTTNADAHEALTRRNQARRNRIASFEEKWRAKRERARARIMLVLRGNRDPASPFYQLDGNAIRIVIQKILLSHGFKVTDPNAPFVLELPVPPWKPPPPDPPPPSSPGL